MKHPPKLREIVSWILLIVAVYFAAGKKYDSVQLEGDKIRAEEKAKLYQEDAKLYHALSEEWKRKAVADSAVIEYQKQNPKIIEKKYVEIRNDYFDLPVDDKIKFLAGWVSKKNNP